MALRRSISASSSGTRIAKIVEICFGRDNSDGNASFLLTYKIIIRDHRAMDRPERRSSGRRVPPVGVSADVDTLTL